MVKQTKISENVREKEKERDRQKDRDRKIVEGMNRSQNIDVTDYNLRIDEQTSHRNQDHLSNLSFHFPDVKHSDHDAELSDQARGRSKSINQRFRMGRNESEDREDDVEISTKSESLSYAVYKRRKGGRKQAGLAPSPSFEGALRFSFLVCFSSFSFPISDSPLSSFSN